MPVVLGLKNNCNTFFKSSFLISHRSVLATAIRQEKEIKGIQIGKEEKKLSLVADNVILCIENPKDFTIKIELVNSVNYKIKINIQICAVFLYSNNKLSENLKTIPL